jgi:4-amino-4-deoxy-L-arabinose transferase-like glycosyltransferase
MSSKSRFVQVCLIVLLAAALRLVFFYQFRASDFYDCPVLDMRTYVQQAQVIAKDGLRGLGVIWRPPLYPALLSLSLKFADSLLPAMILQVLLSSLSAGLIYLVARRFASDGIALAAAGLYAVHWIAIFFSALFLGTSLFIFLLLLSLWLLLVSDATRIAPLILAGLAAGLAALVRTEVLPCVLAWAAWIIWRKRFAHAALFVVAVIIPILPITVHNYRMTGQIIPVTAIGGYNFFVGNNAQADGKTVWASKEALNGLGVSEDLPPLENQSRYMKAALGDILKNPARFAGLMLKKAYYLLNAYEISSNTDIYYVISDTSAMLAVLALFSSGILLPLAVVGFVFGKYDRRAAIPVFLFVIPFALVLLAFFITARFRSPLIPILCVFAALGASTIWNERKCLLTSGRAMLMTLVFLLVFCNTQFFGVADPRDNLDLNLQQAFAFHGQQRMESCGKMLRHVLAVDPQSEPAMYLWRQLPEAPGSSK